MTEQVIVGPGLDSDSGSGTDATDGVQAIKREGGIVIEQDRATAEYFGMRHSAIGTGAVDYVLPLERIGPALLDLTFGRPVQPDVQAV